MDSVICGVGGQGNRGRFRPREQALLRREQCAIAHGNFLATPKGKLIQTTARESELFPKPHGFCYLWSGAPREQRPFPSSRTGALAPGTVRYRARELFGCAKRENDSNNRSRKRAVPERSSVPGTHVPVPEADRLLLPFPHYLSASLHT